MSRATATAPLAPALALTLALAACSPGAGSIPPGTYEATLSGTRSELDGRWALTLEPNGRFRIEFNGRAAVDGLYDLDGEHVYFTDQGGPMKCAADISRGLYAWKADDDHLELAAVTDNCMARRGILATQPLQRRPGRDP